MKLLLRVLAFLSASLIATIGVSIGLFSVLLMQGELAGLEDEFSVENIALAYFLTGLLPTLLAVSILSPVIIIVAGVGAVYFRFAQQRKRMIFDLLILWLIGMLVLAACSELFFIFVTGVVKACPDQVAGLWCVFLRNTQKADPLLMLCVFAISGALGGITQQFMSRRPRARGTFRK